MRAVLLCDQRALEHAAREHAEAVPARAHLLVIEEEAEALDALGREGGRNTVLKALPDEGAHGGKLLCGDAADAHAPPADGRPEVDARRRNGEDDRGKEDGIAAHGKRGKVARQHARDKGEDAGKVLASHLQRVLLPFHGRIKKVLRRGAQVSRAECRRERVALELAEVVKLQRRHKGDEGVDEHVRRLGGQCADDGEHNDLSDEHQPVCAEVAALFPAEVDE